MPKLTDLKQTPNFPQLEEEVMQYWRDDQTFKKSVDERSADRSYIFYDGPPFATGLPHYGHLLASTTKDVIPRYWTMKGYRVERVWGWDCHGLPIENMIEKKLEIKGGKKGIEALGIDTFNNACRSEVLALDKEWEKIIERLGRWVDFKNNYKTMDTTYMESVWWGFKQLYNKDMVYEGKKVILYCPRCSTPLSNFEIAMDNSYREVREPSNTYKYKIVGEEHTFILAWSTTPWNKLATPALAVNPDLKYVKVKQGEEFYILAHTTLKTLKDEPYEVVETYDGKGLEQYQFELHYDFYPNRKPGEKAGIIIADSFVTAQEGTGVVTIAAYGEDDYRVMKQHNIQVVEHVNEEGKMRPEVTPWAGMYILKVNPLVNEDLTKRGLMYSEEMHTHNIAECYRCSTRLYYAPLPAWFIDVQKFKNDLITHNESINWYPEHLKHGRFGKGLENAPDWNISRSRYWGTPMPIWVGLRPQGTGLSSQSSNSDETKQPLLRVIGSLEELKQWAVDPTKVASLTDIHREFLDEIEVWVDDEKTVKGKRIPEVFDCWVESGSMPFASRHYPFEHKQEFEDNYPAQFVSEYIAQTRAWFYTMHVMSVGIFGKPSFENVLTTGTILAEDGSKMSKSKKNYPDPMIMIDKYGVDSLRLYLMSSPVMKSENVNFSEKDVSEIRKRVFVIWWNVFSFYKMYAGDAVINLEQEVTPTDIMDTWMMSRLNSVTAEVTAQMDTYNVVKASRTLIEFVNEISTWYLRRSRDRFREDKNALQVFGRVLVQLAQLFAPITPFFAETMYHNLVDDKSSVHLSAWPKADQTLINTQLEKEMQLVRTLAEKAHATRKDQAIKVRQPLASLTVISEHEKLSEQVLAVLLDEVNVKNAIWKEGESTEVTLDTTLTPELTAEGKARELIRKVQQLRKKENLEQSTKITLTLPEYPESWKERIMKATNAKSIESGTEVAITTF